MNTHTDIGLFESVCGQNEVCYKDGGLSIHKVCVCECVCTFFRNKKIQQAVL